MAGVRRCEPAPGPVGSMWFRAVMRTVASSYVARFRPRRTCARPETIRPCRSSQPPVPAPARVASPLRARPWRPCSSSSRAPPSRCCACGHPCSACSSRTAGRPPARPSSAWWRGCSRSASRSPSWSSGSPGSPPPSSGRGACDPGPSPGATRARSDPTTWRRPTWCCPAAGGSTRWSSARSASWSWATSRPPPSAGTSAASWEIRGERGLWTPIEPPLDRAARDAERVRGWLSTHDRDFLVRIYAAVVTDDQRVERTATCAVVPPRQLAAWLESLPAQRGLTPDRRSRLVELVRSVAAPR